MSNNEDINYLYNLSEDIIEKCYLRLTECDLDNYRFNVKLLYKNGDTVWEKVLEILPYQDKDFKILNELMLEFSLSGDIVNFKGIKAFTKHSKISLIISKMILIQL